MLSLGNRPHAFSLAIFSDVCCGAASKLSLMAHGFSICYHQLNNSNCLRSLLATSKLTTTPSEPAALRLQLLLQSSFQWNEVSMQHLVCLGIKRSVTMGIITELTSSTVSSLFSLQLLIPNSVRILVHQVMFSKKHVNNCAETTWGHSQLMH